VFFGGCAFLALALVVQHSRGKAALRKWLQTTREHGEKLEIAELLPPRPSPRVSVTPSLSSLLKDIPTAHPSTPPLLRYFDPTNAIIAVRLKSWETGKDMERGWDDVEAEIKPYEPILIRVEQTLRASPDFDSGFKYTNGYAGFSVPHLVILRRCSQWTLARGLSALHRGDTATAFAAAETLARLIFSLRNERLLISQLLRQALVYEAFDLTWEIHQSKRLTADQWRDLQELWSQNHFMDDLISATEMERNMTIAHFEIVRTSPAEFKLALDQFETVVSIGDSGIDWGKWWSKTAVPPLWKFVWIYPDEIHALNHAQNLVELARTIRNAGWTAPAISDSFPPLSYAEMYRGKFAPPRVIDTARFVLSSQFGSSPDYSLKRTVTAETLRSIIVSICALERYQLRRGRYPKDLSDGVPELLSEMPRDFMDGKSIRYRSEDGVHFQLYSVGDNGIDDQGSPQSAGLRKTQILDGKDWVWPEGIARDQLRPAE
jgi:hypothetical protein